MIHMSLHIADLVCINAYTLKEQNLNFIFN